MKSARVLSIAILMSVTGAAFADGPFHYPGDITWVPGDRAKVDRAKVVAELRKAERLGQISVGEADSGEGDQALFKTQKNVSRAQVLGELHEAEQLGLISVGDDVPSETAAQERAITEAGLEAKQQSKAAAK